MSTLASNPAHLNNAPVNIFMSLLLVLLSLDAHAASDAWTQGSSLLATTPEAVAGYGAAISADGDLVVVGEPRATVGGVAGAGSVDIWRRQASGWARITTLVDVPPKLNAHFGATVLVAGDTLYVGSPDRLNGAFSQAGALATYVYNATTATWEFFGESFGIESGEHYGLSVAAQGDLHAYGRPGSTVFTGGYVGVQYGTSIDGYAPLSETSGTAGDNFGASIAVYRSTDPNQPDLAVIGAPNQAVGLGPSNGAVYVFANLTHLGGGWQQVAHLTAPNTVPNEFFGRSVAVGPGHVIVGAPGRNKSTGTPVAVAGSVFVFVPDGSGGWIQQSEIFLSPAASYDGFGVTVAYDARSGRIFAGAPGRTVNVFGGSGPTGIVAVFRYERIFSFLFDWVDTAELESLDFPSISQSAGSAVAVSQGSAFVGAQDYDGAGAAANSGRVLVFTADEIFSNGFE